MVDKITKSPLIRFVGFTNDWEERKISELADRYDQLRIPITASDRVAGSTPYYGANGIQDYVDGFTHDGEFILVAEDGANDLKNYPVNYVNGKVWVNNHAHVLQAKETLADNKFLMNAIRNTNVEPFLVGGGRAKLNAKEMMNIKFYVPKLEEQVRIGEYFNDLDNIIIRHQNRLELLNETKKAMLQKMFPKGGDSIPEIRLKEFTDVWEEYKLGEVADIIGGGTPDTNKAEYWCGDIDWYSPVEIGEKIYVYNSQKKITELGLQKSSAKILPIGTVLFTSRAGIGNTAILAKEAATNQGFQSIVPHTDKLDSYFIYSRTCELKRYGEKMGAGSTFLEVSGKQMAKMPILIPTLEEQKAIGRLFFELDNLMILHQRELDLLKDLKKSMLQQMFV